MVQSAVEKDGSTDDGKHKYSTNDRQVLGHLNPNWILGLNNTFTYKGFDLTIYAMARLGQTISSKLLGFYTAKSAITENQLAGTDYWTEQNQSAYYPLRVPATTSLSVRRHCVFSTAHSSRSRTSPWATPCRRPSLATP